MFRSLYVYGHLLTIAFSLLMALAFVTMARRLRESRDLWNGAIFLSTAGGGAVEMLQATRPSALGANVLLASYAVIYVFVTVGFHAQFGREILGERQARYALAIRAYVAFCLALIALLFAGAVTRDPRVVTLWGARSVVVTISPLVAAVMMLVPLGNVALCSELLLRDGPHRRERRIVAVPMIVAPLIAIYELGVFADLGPERLPIGGYFTAFLGIQGVFMLVARLEQADAGRREAERFAGYTLERRIGAGGMAEVFRARKGGADQLGVQKEVAVKRLHADHALDPVFVQMFVDEARLVARLRHPNIVALHDVGLEDGQLYLAMELVDGASLARVVKLPELDGRGLPATVVAEVGVQLADALAHAHELRDEHGQLLDLVHRDVSPQNILLDRAGIVKLTDFGIARTSERVARTATGVLKGKLPYVAPEQVRAEPYDHRADLYAVGVVLFELATGRPPFVAPSDAALIFQIVEGRPALHLLDAIADPLAGAIRAALEPDPARRLASAAELRRRLEPLRDETAARRELGRLAAEAAAVAASGPQLTTSARTVVDAIASRGRDG